MDKGTNKFSVTYLIHGTPEYVYKTFLQKVWWDGGMPWIVPGFLARSSVVRPADDPKTGKGCVRGVGFGMIHEEILDGKVGEFLSYQLKKKGPFWASYHQGRIDFYKAGPDMTRVTWAVTWTPKPLGNLFIVPSVQTFHIFLGELQKYCAPKSSSRGFFSWMLILLMLAYVVGAGWRFSKISSSPLAPSPAYMKELDRLRLETKSLDATIQKHVFLVIGGTGFTGSAIVEDLLRRGAKGVKVMGRSVPPVTEYPQRPGKEGRYPIKGVEYIKGDVTDPAALNKAMAGTTVVFHTAVSYGSPNFAMSAFEKTKVINVGGMENIIKAAKASGTVKQIVYTSSCDTTFTHADYFNATELHPYKTLGVAASTKEQYAEGKWEVGDTYARTKIMAEKLLLSKDKEGGIRTLAIRPNGIYGPGEVMNFGKSINPFWVMGSLVPVYFDLDQRADWTCVYNLVYAHLLAAHKLETDPDSVGGKAYFVTDEQDINTAGLEIFEPHLNALGITLKRWIHVPRQYVAKMGWGLEMLHQWVLEKTGKDIWNPVMLSYKEGLKMGMSHTHDNSRARKDLGYKPLFTTQKCLSYAAEEYARRHGVGA